jgi:hypothetical protein
MPRENNTAPSFTSAVARNLALALMLVCVENAMIFSGIFFSSAGTSGGKLVGVIPGWVIGVVWAALFGSLGIARGVMVADGSGPARRAAGADLILLAACAAYPFYTLGLNNAVIGLFGNIITLCLSAWAAVRTWPVRPLAMAAPLAVFSWVAFATLALIDERHIFGS